MFCWGGWRRLALSQELSSAIVHDDGKLFSLVCGDSDPVIEAALCRAVRIVLATVNVVGLMQRDIEVIACPIVRSVLPRGSGEGANLHGADACFAGPIVAGRAGRGAEVQHAAVFQEAGEVFTFEGGAVVALEDQRSAVVVEDGGELLNGDFGRLIKHRQPGELQAAGQITHREDRLMDTVNGPGRLAVIDGPDRSWLAPLKHGDVAPGALAIPLSVALLQVDQLAAGRLGQ